MDFPTINPELRPAVTVPVFAPVYGATYTGAASEDVVPTMPVGTSALSTAIHPALTISSGVITEYLVNLRQFLKANRVDLTVSAGTPDTSGQSLVYSPILGQWAGCARDSVEWDGPFGAQTDFSLTGYVVSSAGEFSQYPAKPFAHYYFGTPVFPIGGIYSTYCTLSPLTETPAYASGNFASIGLSYNIVLVGWWQTYPYTDPFDYTRHYCLTVYDWTINTYKVVQFSDDTDIELWPSYRPSNACAIPTSQGGGIVLLFFVSPEWRIVVIGGPFTSDPFPASGSGLYEPFLPEKFAASNVYGRTLNLSALPAGFPVVTSCDKGFIFNYASNETFLVDMFGQFIVPIDMINGNGSADMQELIYYSTKWIDPSGYLVALAPASGLDQIGYVGTSLSADFLLEGLRFTAPRIGSLRLPCRICNPVANGTR